MAVTEFGPVGQDEASAEPAIWTEKLVKTFGHLRALRGIDLSLAHGESLVLFGPNGAGKTTLLRILATLSKPTSGRALIDGIDLREDPGEVRRRIGVISHQTFLYDDLTAVENLRFFGRMYDVPHLEERIATVLDQVVLTGRANDRVRTFSRGMQQRVSIARAVLHSPPILLLDEPDTGLDDRAAGILHEVIIGLEGVSRTVIMTTHHFERGLDVASRVAVIHEGRLLREGAKGSLTAAELRQEFASLTGGKRKSH